MGLKKTLAQTLKGGVFFMRAKTFTLALKVKFGKTFARPQRVGLVDEVETLSPTLKGGFSLGLRSDSVIIYYFRTYTQLILNM